MLIDRAPRLPWSIGKRSKRRGAAHMLMSELSLIPRKDASAPAPPSNNGSLQKDWSLHIIYMSTKSQAGAATCRRAAAVAAGPKPEGRGTTLRISHPGPADGRGEEAAR